MSLNFEPPSFDSYGIIDKKALTKNVHSIKILPSNQIDNAHIKLIDEMQDVEISQQNDFKHRNSNQYYESNLSNEFNHSNNLNKLNYNEISIQDQDSDTMMYDSNNKISDSFHPTYIKTNKSHHILSKNQNRQYRQKRNIFQIKQNNQINRIYENKLDRYTTDLFTVPISEHDSYIFQHKRIMVFVLEFMEIEEWLISIYNINKVCNHLIDSLWKSKHSVFEVHWRLWEEQNKRIIQLGDCWFPSDCIDQYVFRWKMIRYIEQYVLPYHFISYIEKKTIEISDEATKEQWIELLKQIYELKQKENKSNHSWKVSKEYWEQLQVVYSGELFGIDVDVFISRGDSSIRVNIDDEGFSNDLSFVKDI